MPRRALFAVFLPLLALLPACANPWAENYKGARLNALPSDATVRLVPSRAAEIEKADKLPGYVLLGRCQFEQTQDAGEGTLEDFARSIGSPLVWFSIKDAGEKTRKVRQAQYVPSSAYSGGGAYVDADGVVRSVDTTNNLIYVDVEREVTERIYKHAAVFFVPEGTETK